LLENKSVPFFFSCWKINLSPFSPFSASGKSLKVRRDLPLASGTPDQASRKCPVVPSFENPRTTRYVVKKNLPVNGRETAFPDDWKIVSSTNLKGALSHVNQAFVDVSGFVRDELLGKNHNVVRHPDMPPAAFQNLWDDLKQSKPWMGIVKNRCKDGSYYWVDAYVMPVFENGVVVGYESVRVKPEQEDVEWAEALYKKLWSGKGMRGGWSTLALHRKLAIQFSALLALVCGALVLEPSVSVATAALSWLGGSVAGYAIGWWDTRSLRQAVRHARSIADNPVMQYVYTGQKDEGGALSFALRLMQGGVRTVLGRIQDSAGSLRLEAEQTAATVQQISQSMLRQRQETELLATAMEEMAGTVKEIAQNTVHTSDLAELADEEANRGMQKVDTSIQSTRALASEVERAAGVIARLDKDSDSIGTVLDVIRGVADQTNLLALNAAIEAARAGDQGLGFAVVADEVRTLASRTQDSTEEIHRMIEQFQKAAREAVDTMKAGQARTAESVRYAGEVGEQLGAIAASIGKIKDMAIQVASAAEEQGTVSETISGNIHNINDVAEETANGAATTAQSARNVADMSDSLQALVSRFQRL